MNTIEIKNLNNFYRTSSGEKVHALKGVNLEIEDGEVISVWARPDAERLP